VSFTVVIPTKTASNLTACLMAVRESEPPARVIVVDDGLPADFQPPRSPYLGGPTKIIPGIKPFCFSRNCNIGIRAAYPDDVILLNDDAMLRTPWGFTNLSLAARSGYSIQSLSAFFGYGIVGAVTNTCQMEQRRMERTSGVRPLAMVAFLCAYLRREMLDRIGLMDEEFTDYGDDDDDLCYRARQSGYQVGVCDGCFVDHLAVPSSYLGENRQGRRVSFDHNNAVFFRKHRTTPDAIRAAWVDVNSLLWDAELEQDWSNERSLLQLNSMMRQHNVRNVLEAGGWGQSTMWLAVRSSAVAIMSQMGKKAAKVFSNSAASAGIWEKIRTINIETFAADLAYIHSRGTADMRTDIVRCFPQSRIICGGGYQRESVREMLRAVLPGHGAEGGFWWMVKP
jgi:GT2 family glycosyltransferase